MSESVRPFTLAVPQAELDDLRRRIADTRWPTALSHRWDRGVPVPVLRELAERWAALDWRAAEAELNGFGQYTTDIDGQTLHFLHVRSPEPDALPLLLTHSWPNSVAEFTRIIGPLTDPRAHGGDPAQAFHVVAPSLPGFGFAAFDKAPDPEPWSLDRVADLWAALMARLGYTRYGAHGNDAGALVTPKLALADPEHVVGSHITGGVGMPTGDPEELAGLDDKERAEVEFVMEMFGGSGGSEYAPYLANRPQTLGYGLTDSPTALLAYLLERYTEFDGWPEGDAAPEPAFDLDQFLTTVSLYWFGGTAASAMWPYYEGAAGMPIDQDRVPTGVSHGGSAAFRRLAERGNDIAHWADHESPSHMVAMADPGNLVLDLREFFGRLR